MIQEDLNIIFDESGFAERRNLNGTPNIICLVGDKNTGRSELDGLWVTMFEVMFKKADILLPIKNKKTTFDGVSYMVENIKDDGSVITVIFSSPRDGAMLNKV